MLEWSSSLIVDQPIVDKQHLEMLLLLNLLEEAVHQHRSPHLVSSILDDLVVHTRHHFSSEEEIMASLDCPGLEKHREVHRALEHMLVNARTEFLVNGSTLTDDLLEYLKHWFVSHVKEMDAPAFEAVARPETR